MSIPRRRFRILVLWLILSPAAGLAAQHARPAPGLTPLRVVEPAFMDTLARAFSDTPRPGASTPETPRSAPGPRPMNMPMMRPAALVPHLW